MERASSRPWQFSLKWFLFATTFLAVLIGVVGQIVHQIELRRQQAAQARLAQERARAAMIAKLEWERLVHTHMGDDGLEALVDVRAVDDSLKKRLVGVAGLKTVTFNGTLSDSQLIHISGIQQLESIDLHRSPITGQGLVQLKSMPNLKSLNLSQSRIDDEALKILCQISTLEDLKLYQVPVRGSGLGHFKTLSKMRSLTYFAPSLREIEGLDQLDQIERLKLVGPGLSDRHIDQIAEMEKLKWLLVILEDDRVLASMSRLKNLERIYFTVRSNDSNVAPQLLNEIRGLSAELPTTSVFYQTHSTRTVAGSFRGGMDWTPPSGWPPPSEMPGYISIQAVFDPK